MESIKDAAIRIAMLAGDKIKELRENRQFKESLKDGCELVTTADIISNELIKTEISRMYPSHIFVSEEESDSPNLTLHQPTWIVDPIDGTVGYANNHYQVAVSIAFAVEGKIRVGVVYNPFLYELFYALDGGGAFLNGHPIHVKTVFNLNECVIGTGFPHKREAIQGVIELLGRVIRNVRDIRRLGSPALDICWVACGRLQGFYEGKLHPWDVAAAKLIAIEAGAKTGYYADIDNSIPKCINGNGIIISSPGIFKDFKALLSDM